MCLSKVATGDHWNKKKPELFITPANAQCWIAWTILRLELSHIGRLRPFSAFLLHKAYPLTFAQ